MMTCPDRRSYSSLSDGVQVQQYPCNGQKNQSWLALQINDLKPAVLVNENSGKCLDVRPNTSGNFTADTDAIQQYTCHFGPNQQWNVLPVVAVFGTPTLGTAIVNTNSNKCIDVPGLSTSQNVLLQQYTCNFGANQLWNPNSLFLF
jgi:endoglucanase